VYRGDLCQERPVWGSPAVKTVLYVQLLKQLTDNPNGASEAKGWEMLALMLSCFPPPELFVAMFIEWLSMSVLARADGCPLPTFAKRSWQ
jgi:hypothetical protein